MFSIVLPSPKHIKTLLSTQQAGTASRMKLRLKGFGLLLLLVLLALCSTIDVCDAARRGKHWRPRSSPSSSLLKRKGKTKKGSSHRQHGGSRPSPKQPVSPPPGPGAGKGYQTPYQPSPNAPAGPSPQPSPTKGNGHQSPKSPPPSCGKGNQPPPQPPPATSEGAVFNVVDFGANGDGVSDDTKVSIFFLREKNKNLSCIMHSLAKFLTSNSLFPPVSFAHLFCVGPC
jgi:hypothetical protein